MNKHKHHKHCQPHCGHPPHCGCPPHHSCWDWLVALLVALFGLSLVSLLVCFWDKFIRREPMPSNEGGLRVAFIGNYRANCGISTYNEDLIPQIQKGVYDVRVFAEYADATKSERIAGDPDFIVRCWSRKHHPKQNLITKILEYNPDVIHISHEYGLFPRAYQFTTLVSILKGFGKKVVATLHSVYTHKDKTVQENAPDYLIVHTEEAWDTLVHKGIDGNKIFVIPHGTPLHTKELSLAKPEWNTWHSDHTIFHAGFLFDYKGHERMMRVTAKLKEKYPDVQYIIQGSENPLTMTEHGNLYKRLLTVSKELGIEHNVTINRGFVRLDVLLSHINTVKVCVLPYATHPDHDVRATSGIARLVLGTSTPLVTSTVHLFDDVKNVAVRASNDNELYEAIDKIFQEGKLSDEMKAKRLEFLEITSWENVGKQTVDLYNKVADL